MPALDTTKVYLDIGLEGAANTTASSVRVPLKHELRAERGGRRRGGGRAGSSALCCWGGRTPPPSSRDELSCAGGVPSRVRPLLSALEHRSTASAGEHHRPAPWRGSVVHDAAPSVLYHASHPQWPSRPPLELAPSGSQIERGRLSRTVAGRTRIEPSPFAAAASRQPSAVQPYSRQPSARSRRRCRPRSSSERAPASCCRRSVDARRPAASERARSWVGARAGGRRL